MLLKKYNYIFTGIFLLLFLSCFFSLSSCKTKEAIEYQDNQCQRQPPFIRTIGLDPSRAAFSTSEKKMMGLVLLQLARPGDTSGKTIYQHPSWKTAGWMGPVQIDASGNCFAAPVPIISLADNAPADQNIIYRVDAASGEMKKFVSLPVAEHLSAQNPYGILGFAYLCESNTIYVSSVQGSTRDNTAGVIYALDAADGKIIDKLEHTDAIGMGISYISGSRMLFFGSARSSEVYEVALGADGKFSGKAARVFSIAGLGPRGDDKVRRIKFNKTTGQMQVIGVEFNFNLTAPTEKQETIYPFSWSEEDKSWIHNK